ncbi:Uma2 family endonuclease [Holophaga foetida]|uniref:Uma2 family endonuclease n=1 Tax=Holophaga foetida TaxID=35839 RepID=UPI0002472107|nr:Uma2 family endonuclease [Holophaga foetida]
MIASKEFPVNLPQPRQTGYTLDDWQTWEGRWELLDGVAYNMTPSPNPEHQRVATELVTDLNLALREDRKRCGGGSCQVIAAPIDVFLPTGVVVPDLVVVCDPAKITQRGVEGAPDLVVEILSPSTAARDHSIKRWAYEAAGVPEYLIVDPEQQLGILLHLQNGRYEEAARITWGSLAPLLSGRISVPLG